MQVSKGFRKATGQILTGNDTFCLIPNLGIRRSFIFESPIASPFGLENLASGFGTEADLFPGLRIVMVSLVSRTGNDAVLYDAAQSQYGSLQF